MWKYGKGGALITCVIVYLFLSYEEQVEDFFF